MKYNFILRACQHFYMLYGIILEKKHNANYSKFFCPLSISHRYDIGKRVKWSLNTAQINSHYWWTYLFIALFSSFSSIFKPFVNPLGQFVHML